MTLATLEPLAAALADQSRLAMLCELMDGRAYTSKELALVAGITAQTATPHLARLRDAGLIRSEKQGRAIYHALASAEVADWIETASGLSPQTTLYDRMVRDKRTVGLRVARRCYDHLAGKLGVQVTRVLTDLGALERSSAGFDARSHGVWSRLGVDAPEGGKACLDWTERKPHLGGPGGRQLLASMINRGWIGDARTARGLALTEHGQSALHDILGLGPEMLDVARQ